MFDQRIGKFKKGDFMRDDHGYKEIEEQALQLMMQCDELTDVGPNVKAKRKRIIHNIEQMWNKFESKVLVYKPLLYGDEYSVAV